MRSTKSSRFAIIMRLVTNDHCSSWVCFRKLFAVLVVHVDMLLIVMICSISNDLNDRFANSVILQKTSKTGIKSTDVISCD